MMELINKEFALVLINDIRNRYMIMIREYARCVGLDAEKMQKDAYEDIENRIDELLTIKSRTKGEWLRKEYYFDEWVDECSVCGEAYTMIDGTATENGYNYCPNCGAYMFANMRGE